MSNSNVDSSSLELPPEFEDYLNFDSYIPHKLKLFKSNNEKNADKSNFINSTLYCLTNLKYFLEFLYKCDDLSSPAFKVLKQTIVQIYDSIKSGVTEYNSYVFNKFILERIKLFQNPLYRNPRFLIDCILNKFFLVNNSSNFSSKSSGSNETNISILSQLSLDSNNSDINFSVKESYGIERDTFVEDKIFVKILKNSRIKV